MEIIVLSKISLTERKTPHYLFFLETSKLVLGKNRMEPRKGTETQLRNTGSSLAQQATTG